MLTKGKLLLASSSPRRLKLLEGIGLKVEVYPSNIEEIVGEGEKPQEFTVRIAREKAREVLSRINLEDDFWVIGADTIVVCQGNILNKPKDIKEAKEMLSLISGKTHKVITSFCILGSKDKKESVESVESYVSFTRMSDNEINWYVNTEEPLDKAGAYGAQGFGMMFIDSIEGSYTNVVGLPLSHLVRTLLDMGVITF